jgi:hypothetical protein
VLLPGMRTQDEAAEDPLAAAKGGQAADYDLYWHNKLRRPLSEILTTCLTAAQLQVLLVAAMVLDAGRVCPELRSGWMDGQPLIVGLCRSS